MKDQPLIPTLLFPAYANLQSEYAAAQAALLSAESASILSNDVYGELCEQKDYLPPGPTVDDNEARWLPWKERMARNGLLSEIAQKERVREYRRIAYYASQIRVQGEVRKLYDAWENLAKAVDAYRKEIDGCTTDEQRKQVDAAMCNVFLSEQVASEAYRSYRAISKSTGYGLSLQMLYGPQGAVDMRASLVTEYQRLAREWVVMASGHGSEFRFDGAGDGREPPPGPYNTIDEARAEGIAWECTADTIGGRAQLFNVRTAKTRSLDD